MASIPPGRSLLAYIFSRIGADVGACIRGMLEPAACRSKL